MNGKILDSVFVGLLALSLGTTASLSARNARVSGAISGGVMGGATGLAIARVRELAERRMQELERQIRQLEGSGSTDSENLDRFQSIQAQLQQFEQERAEMVEQLQSLRDRLQHLDPVPQQLQDLNSTSSAIAEQLNSNGDRAMASVKHQEISTAQPSPDNRVASTTLDDPPPVDGAIEWLESKGIQVTDYKTPDSSNITLDRLALFLGDRYDRLSELDKKIRQGVTQNHGVKFNLASSDQQTISDATNFCKRLHDYGFVDYRYDNKYRKIHLMPHSKGAGVSFLNGEWLERFVYQKVKQLLTDNEIEYHCLLNPKIKFSNGDESELDMVFTVAGNPLWIECKVGQYQDHIQRYSSLAKSWHISPSEIFLIVSDIDSNLATDLNNLHEITVANLENLTEKISNNFNLNYRDTSAKNGYTSPINDLPKHQEIDSLEKLESVFNQGRIRPLPDIRQKFLQCAIDVISSLQEPQSVNYIKDRIKSYFPELSNTKFGGLIKVLLYSDCLVDSNGGVVRNFNQPISRLISNHWEDLEKQCIEAYAYKVLEIDPNYFESEQNCLNFKQVVGSEVPKQETIQSVQAKIRQKQASDCQV